MFNDYKFYNEMPSGEIIPCSLVCRIWLFHEKIYSNNKTILQYCCCNQKDSCVSATITHLLLLDLSIILTIRSSLKHCQNRFYSCHCGYHDDDGCCCHLLAHLRENHFHNLLLSTARGQTSSILVLSCSL